MTPNPPPLPPAPVVHDFSADLRDLAEDATRARLRALLSRPPATR